MGPGSTGSESRIPTGTATFLFTDLVGSTSSWDRQPSEMEASLRRHDEIVRREVFDGRAGAGQFGREGDFDLEAVVFGATREARSSLSGVTNFVL